MSDYAVVGQRIVNSIFPTGDPNNGQYVAHLKIWEDVPGEQTGKARYIILASACRAQRRAAA